MVPVGSGGGVMIALLPTDRCGNCATPEVVVTCHPWRVVADGESTRAWYRCPACGHAWVTGWGTGAAALPCPGCGQCEQEAQAAA